MTMIHVMLPSQYLQRGAPARVEPHKRLMAAVLQTVVDDHCGLGRKGSAGQQHVATAAAYLSSTDRTWPFSFENVCEALGINAGRLRQELQKGGRP